MWRRLRPAAADFRGRIYDHKSALRLGNSGLFDPDLSADSEPPLAAYDTARRFVIMWDLKKIQYFRESQKRSYHYFAQGKSELEKLYFAPALTSSQA